MHLTPTELGRLAKRAEEKTLLTDRLKIGSRLIACFGFIIVFMLVGDAIIFWQFDIVRTHTERLNSIDQKLTALLRVQASLVVFRDRLEALAQSEDAAQLAKEAGPLRAIVLEDTQRARSDLSLLPSSLQRDATIMPTLLTIQSAFPSEVDAITNLASAGDWRAVRLRLTNQIGPLVSLTSDLVEKVDSAANEERAETVENARRVQRRVFLIVPITAIFTFLMAGTLGLAITRSITRPLERLVEGSKALARGEFQHQVAISGEDELAHLGQVFNDTARQLQDLYATLRNSEDRLQRVIDTIPAHVWSAQPDGTVDFINQRWVGSAGLSLEKGADWDWSSIVHPEDRARFLHEWQTAFSAGEPMESEARLGRTDGKYRWWLIRNVPLRDNRGKILNWYGVATDIEDRKRAEEEREKLRQLEADLIRALNEQLIKALEGERMRIAGELHDGVLQQITSLSLRLGTAKRQVPPDSPARATISGLQQELIQIGTDVRHISHELHPALLHEAGLPTALSSYCEEFSKVRGLPVSCQTDESVKELSPGSALCLYRIAQEALGNAAKYSEAKKVEVRLTRSDSRVCLSVSDDGVGCAPGQIGKSGGLGVINMRERVLQLNGTFEFDSEPGRGTAVKVEIPFRPAS